MNAAVRLGLNGDDSTQSTNLTQSSAASRRHFKHISRMGGQLDVDLNDSASESSHGRHDRRSLALHLEAVRMLQEQPALAQRVLDVLDRWETVADLQSKMLRDEWRRIVLGRLWDLAIEDSERGRQLRQASPLGFVLVTSVRDAIFRTYRTRRK